MKLTKTSDLRILANEIEAGAAEPQEDEEVDINDVPMRQDANNGCPDPGDDSMFEGHPGTGGFYSWNHQ